MSVFIEKKPFNFKKCKKYLLASKESKKAIQQSLLHLPWPPWAPHRQDHFYWPRQVRKARTILWILLRALCDKLHQWKHSFRIIILFMLMLNVALQVCKQVGNLLQFKPCAQRFDKFTNFKHTNTMCKTVKKYYKIGHVTY